MTENPAYTIELLIPDNIDEANNMRLASWLDTYVNDELGITHDWISKRNEKQMSDEYRNNRLERLKSEKSTGWVVKDSAGTIIGVATPRIDDEGVQHVGSLYVDKNWHGKGIAGELMQRIINWFDDTKPIILGVVTYNERAKAFYRKWGFVEIPGSETLYDNKIPEIMMSRLPENTLN
ncbi:MAG: GNAT family N-acetyltransferase [Candidatus Saccharimonadales bacterium]